MSERPPSFRDRLATDLAGIEAQLAALLDISTIRYVNPNREDASFFVFGAADWGWGPSDDSQQLARIRLTQDYEAWWARFQTLFAGITPELREEVGQADIFTRSWITRGGGWDHYIPRTVPEAKAVAVKEMAPLSRALDLLGSQGGAGTRLVPDTSALMDQPTLAAYAPLAAGDALTIHLLPEVIKELDALKDGGRTPEQRTRARTALRAISDLRALGALTKGVEAAPGLTVIARALEPRFEGLPAWLDPATGDDRVLAGALEVQAENPTSVVLLVASDLNIQNKAEVLGLPSVGTPQSEGA